MKYVALLVLFVCLFAMAVAENLSTPPPMPAETPVAVNSKLAAIEKKYNPDQKQVAKAWKKEFQHESLQKVRLVNEQIQNAKKELAELRKQYKELKASKDSTSDSNDKYKSLERQALLIKDEAKRAEFLKRIDNRRGTVVNQSNSVAEKFRSIRSKRDYFKNLISNLRKQRKESYKKAVDHIKLQRAVFKKMIDAQYKRMFDLTAELGKVDEAKKKEIAAQLETARKNLKEMKGRNESVNLANKFFKKEKKAEDKNKAARVARDQQKKEKREKTIVSLKNKIAVEKDSKKLEKLNTKLKALTKEEKKEVATQEKKEASNLEKLVANYKQLLQKARESNNAVVAKALQKTIDSLTKKSDKLKDDAKKLNPGSCLRVGHVKKCKLHKKSFPNGEYYCTRTIFKSECYKCAATKTKAVKVDTKTSEVEVQRTTGKCEAVITAVPDTVVASIKKQAYDQLVLDKKVQKHLADKLKTISPSSPAFANVLPDLIKNDRCTRRTYNKILKKLVQTPENAKAIQSAALSIKKEDVPEATRFFKAKLSATQIDEIKNNKNNEIAIKAALSKTVDNIKKVGIQEKVEPAQPAAPAVNPASIAAPFNPTAEQPKVTVSLVKPSKKATTKKPAAEPKVTVSLVKPAKKASTKKPVAEPKVTVSLVKPAAEPKVTVSLVKPAAEPKVTVSLVKPAAEPKVTVSLVKPAKKAAAKKSGKKSNVTEKRVKKNGKTIIYRTYKVKDCRKGCGFRVVKMKITLGKKKCNKKGKTAKAPKKAAPKKAAKAPKKAAPKK